MRQNTSVPLSDYFEDLVENKIAAGRYKNASEVIRAGLKLLEEEENRRAASKSALQDGMNSGIAKNFNSADHLESLKAERNKMAEYLLTNKAVEDLLKNLGLYLRSLIGKWGRQVR